MLTYEDIVRIYRSEKNSPTLQKIPETFYADVKELVSKVEESHGKYLATLIDDIYERRKNKVVMHSLRTEDYAATPSNIAPLEKDLYDRVVGVLKSHRKSIIEQKVVEEEAEEPPAVSEKLMVKILKAVPSIVGPDMNDYGPFTKDVVVQLPAENARILIERGYAERL